MRQYFWRSCFNLRFKIDVVVIWSIVIIINSVLTLQVSTASLPHHREPCEIKVASNHTCSLHTCVCAGSRRVRERRSGFRRQGISSTPGGFLKCPIPVRVCAEQTERRNTKREERFWRCSLEITRVGVFQFIPYTPTQIHAQIILKLSGRNKVIKVKNVIYCSLSSAVFIWSFQIYSIECAFIVTFPKLTSST